VWVEAAKDDLEDARGNHESIKTLLPSQRPLARTTKYSGWEREASESPDGREIQGFPLKQRNVQTQVNCANSPSSQLALFCPSIFP
jgi:hypothetical protein